MSSAPAGAEGRWEEDVRLARACARGDDGAWHEMEVRHFPYVRAFARRFGLPEDAAEDVAQEVIGDLWRRKTIARYEGRSALRTWLGALVTNAAMTAHTRLRGREAREQRAAPPAATPAGSPGAALETLLAEVTSAALEALEARPRLLVLLHYEQGLTLEEIGRLEGLSKATISRVLKRIRAGLRADIERRLAARGVSWDELRPDVDLALLDLGLGALLARSSAAEPSEGDAV